MGQIKKRVAWITVPAFISTDRFIIPELAKIYDINWYLIVKNGEKIDFADNLSALSKEYGFNYHIITLFKRNLAITTALDYRKFLKQIKEEDYDLIYNVMIGIPYYMPFLKMIIGNKNVLVAIHNVHVPKGGSMYIPSILYTNYTIKAFKYFQTFSVSQKNALLKKASDKYCGHVNFMLMDYGTPSIIRNNDVITFLSFGIIREYKRIDVIIQAAEEAFEEVGITFRVIIAGGCDDWDKYQALIRHKELFDLRIRRISDSEVPNLFGESHYFVAPYQDIAQSGSAIIAINYNVPVIASRLEAFESYIEQGKTGFLIKPASKSDLKKVFTYILLNHDRIYRSMSDQVEKEKHSKFSSEIVSKGYEKNFKQVIKG